jgi:hypothetical protein
MDLLAGAARLEITPAPGIELMGYGARTGRASGVHDPLYARALALRSSQNGPESSSVVLVSADLCLITPDQALWIRQEVARKVGLVPEAVLVSCTHTHSGPDTGLAAHLSGREEPPYVASLLGTLAEAGSRAWATASPARLRWNRTATHIGRNRRRADGPLDPEILVLQVQDDRGATRAVLYHHACHGTVLGHDNLEISADWPGVASARIEEATGGTALFALGAHADIDPRTRGLMDLAISGQSRGLGFDAVECLGGEVAEAVLESLGSPGGAADEVPIAAAARSIRLPIHLGDRPEGTARKELGERREELARWLGVSAQEFPRLSELEARVRARTTGLPPSEAREWIARARLYVRDRTGRHWTGGAHAVDVEAQVLRIGEGAFLALPLEPTTQVGLDWKLRARSRVPFSGVVGIANGWLRYLPHPEDLADPLAHQRYEVLSSLLAPGACEKLLNLGETLLDETLTG